MKKSNPNRSAGIYTRTNMRTQTTRTRSRRDGQHPEDTTKRISTPQPVQAHETSLGNETRNPLHTTRMQPPKTPLNRRPTSGGLLLATTFLILVQSRVIAQSQSMPSASSSPGASSESPNQAGPSEWSASPSGHRRLQELVEAPRARRSDIEAEQPDESRPEMSVATRPTNSDELELVPRGETSGATASRRPGQSQHADSKLHIVRLFAPDSIQNGSQDVTIDCMFKHDKKLDQRLAIKWFFNDELEPIYQWIPELNGRVYSKRYEHLIDKHYQVTEDVDFMLQAYKWLLGSTAGVDALERDWDQVAAEGRLNLLAKNLVPTGGGGGGGEQQQQAPDEQQVAATRKLLANKLSRLAKLGGDHSRQLIATLRTALAMDDQDVSRFRALRLLRPGVEMSGRFTCSISSLDGDDLKSTRLTVYEPPRSFTFNVSKTSSHSYNLTCQAGPTFPRPSIALYRYRPNQLEARPSPAEPSDEQRRAKSATASIKQELLPGTQVQLQISAKRQGPHESRDKLTEFGSNGLPRVSLDLEDELANSLQPIADEADEERKITRRLDSSDSKQPPGGPFEVSAWALVDEASLNNNLVTEFECVVSLEGANYELRQTLALQRGWHVNSSPLTAKSTLVGLLSILASLLCLAVALVSTILIFKLLRRHASKSGRLHTGHTRRVSPRKSPSSASDRGQSNGGCETGSSTSASPSSSPSEQSTTGAMAPGDAASGLPRRGALQQHGEKMVDSESRRGQLEADREMRMAAASHFGQKAPPGGRALATRHVPTSNMYQQHQAIYSAAAGTRDFDEQDEQNLSDGIYRVPERRSSFGTRYLAAAVGLNNQQQIWPSPFNGPAGLSANLQQTGQRYSFSCGAHPDAAELEAAEQRQPLEVGDPLHNGQVGGLKLGHYQSSGMVTPASRGMPTATNQLAGQKAQLRPAQHQPGATISVNGKQLYC